MKFLRLMGREGEFINVNFDRVIFYTADEDGSKAYFDVKSPEGTQVCHAFENTEAYITEKLIEMGIK